MNFSGYEGPCDWPYLVECSLLRAV